MTVPPQHESAATDGVPGATTRTGASSAPADGPAPAPERHVTLASTAVFAIFFFAGFNFANWVARLPAVRDALALTPEQLGGILLVGATGSLVALPLSGLVVQRLGASRTIVWFAVVNVTGLVLAGTAVTVGSVWLLVLALAVFGVGNGVWDAAMNLEGAAVEQRLRRAIMPRFHAGFSFGTMAGAGLGALAAWMAAPVLTHLAVVLALSMVGVVLATRFLLPEGTHGADGTDEPERADGGVGTIDATEEGSHPGAGAGMSPAVAVVPAEEEPARRSGTGSAWREPRTLLIGVVVLAAALTEGAANDWVALAVVDGFGTSNEVGAIGFGAFVTAMTAMRLLGTGLLNRWGRVPVLRLTAALSLVGLVVFALVPNIWVALAGVMLWGMGAALGFPVGMSAASDDPRHAPARVAVVATIGYSAFFVGPPLLGLLAEQVGYRQALLAITVPVVIGLLVIQAARPLPTAAGAAAPSAR